MKTVPVMEIRRHLGEMLDEVRLKNETVIIERAGRPMAKLCPIGNETEPADTAGIRLRVIGQMAGMGGITRRGRTVEQWLDQERSSWDRLK